MVVQCIMTSQQPFTQRLRAASKSQHAVADALVVAKLLVAFTDSALYGAAIGCFFHVYQAIESNLHEQRGQPALMPLRHMLPRVERLAQIEQDLHHFLGPDWALKIKPSWQVQAFVDRISTVAKAQPHLLAAHSYAMHSALLAGGQLIRRMLIKHMQLEGKGGTAMFDYKEAVKPLQNEYKAAFNALPEVLTEQQAQEVLQEHAKVFEFNIAIVKQFDVGYRQYTSALLEFLPKWAYVAFILVIVAVLLKCCAPWTWHNM